MGQILKFQGGGSTPASSWGTFTIDNVTYNMDDDNIRRLYDHAKTLDPEVAYQFDFIINALKSGKDIGFSNNKLYGNVVFDVKPRQAQKMKEKAARGFGKGRDARLAISSLKDLHLSNPIPETKSIDLSKRFAEYERDDEGNYILDENSNKKWIKGANNQEILDLLDQIETLALSSEDFNITGIENKSAQWLRNFYNSYGKDGWANLKTKISSGSWDQATVEALNDINLFIDREITKEEQAERTEREQREAEAKAAKEKSAIYGARNFDPNLEHLIKYDANTKSFRITNEQLENAILSLGNVWLNDEFAQANPQYASLLEGHDNGLFVINGKIYDADDDALLKIPLMQQWIAENKRKEGGSNLIKWDWVSNPEDAWITDKWNNQSVYNTYSELPVYRDLTGIYSNLGKYGDKPISQIFQVYPDNITPEMYDEFGFFKPEYYEYRAASNGELINNLDSEYLKGLRLANDSNKQQYYSNLPSYLKQSYIDQNGDQLVQILDNVLLYRGQEKDQYITLVKTKDGNFKYVYLNDKYEKGKNPLDYVDLNDVADLSAFGLSNEYGIPVKKKGGKIIKAKEGYIIPEDVKKIYEKVKFEKEPTIFDPNSDNKFDPNKEVLKKAQDYARKVELAAYQDPQNVEERVGSIKLWHSPNKQRPIVLSRNNALVGKLKTVTPIHEYVEEHPDLANSELEQYGGKDNNNNFKLNFPGLDRLSHALISASKIRNTDLAALNRMRALLTPDFINYKTPPYAPDLWKYAEARQKLLNTPDVQTSDLTARQNFANTKLGQMINIDLSENKELSDFTNKYIDKNLAIFNQETQENNNIWKEYKKQLASLEQSKANVLNRFNLTSDQSIHNWLSEQAMERSKYKQGLTNIKNQELQLQYNEQLYSKIKGEFDKLGGMSSLTDDQKEMYGTNIVSYMQNEHPEIIAKIKSELGINYLYDSLGNTYPGYHSIYAKKGTKLPYNNLFVAQNKATHKATENLSKDLIKIFLQMMK